MSDKTEIAWTDATWNPVVGCSRCSPGCDFCYAIRDAWRLAHNPNEKVSAAYRGLVKYKTGLGALDWTAQVRCLPERLEIPLKWGQPKHIFVNSLSDLFHEQVPDEFILQVFAVMADCPQHRFQILTKRPERMVRFFTQPYLTLPGHDQTVRGAVFKRLGCGQRVPDWPLRNVWLGVSVENQQAADERIPLLLQTPAAVRFLSVEPLLGPIDLHRALLDTESTFHGAYDIMHGQLPGLHWVIVGGESGPGARPCYVNWIRSIVEQCKAANVACFVKQLGEYPILDPRYDRSLPGWSRKLRDRKGGDIEEFPEDLRVREFPHA
jgi:protein gp37